MRLLFLLFILLCNTAFAAESLDKVIAVVNSSIITQSQLDQQMNIAKAQGAPAVGLREQVINQLIDNALQLDVAKKANITVSDKEVSDTIGRIAAQNNIPVDQLIKGVAAQGMDEKTYREQIKQQIIIHAVQQKALGPQVKVTQQDITDASHFVRPATNPNAQYHVIDILVSDKDQANQLMAKLQKTSNPADVLSNDPSIKSSDLGSKPLSQFPSIFTSVISNLKPGQFSSPIDAPNGVHILQLVEVTGQQAMPAMTPQQLAFEHKFTEAQQLWLQKLRSQAYIKIVNNE